MRPNFADCKALGKPLLFSLSKDTLFSLLQSAGMDESKNGGPNNLRAWRTFMQMTQEELAAACKPPTTGAVISLLEEGERGLSLKWLRRLAPALKTRPGFIIEYDPHDVDTRTLEMISRLEPAQKKQVQAIIETFLDRATNG